MREHMKRVLLAMLCVAVFAGARSQTMGELFVAMPDSLLPAFTGNDRADFVDFLAAGMRARVKNKFGRVAEMRALTADYLLLETSSAGTLEMKLLQADDSTRVVVAATTCRGPAEDSRLSFYTTAWEPLPADRFITLPVPGDFLLRADTIDTARRDAALLRADVFLLRASLSAGSAAVDFTCTTPDYMDEEAARALRPFLTGKAVRYEWTDGRFIKQQ